MADSAQPSTSGVLKKVKTEKKKDKKKDKKDILTYQKRAGTSGIRGQLYETKLLSLIYLKSLHDEVIEEFFLATNVDEIGMFDDICLRAKLKGFDKPIQVFIQAKHRENDKLLTLTNKKDLASCFDSYLIIKRRFQPNNKDLLFEGTFDETDCAFVMYTTAKDDGNIKTCEDNLVTYLNKLIGTGNVGCQPSYTNEDVELLCQQVLEEQLVTLAQKVAKYMFVDAKIQMMSEELMLRYHVILAQEVFDVSEIFPEGHRIASFRQDFFSKSSKFLQIFKDTLCSEILERRKIDYKDETQSLLKRFLSESDSETLCRLLRGNIVTLKHGNLEFSDKMVPQPYKVQLERVNYNKKDVRDKSVELAVRECKPSLEFKVPATFGNIDIAIRGDDAKINKRLDYLCKKLIDLIENTKLGDIVTLDDSIEDGLLRLNGGLSSAVGNIFVLDNITKLYKFCENCESLGSIAKIFYSKLQSKLLNMADYKFDLRAKLFPKLFLDRSELDEHLVKDFFSKLVFYTSQGDENDVEKKIRDEIKISLGKYHSDPETRSDAIYLKYHDEVQKWWMTPKEGSYLTKQSELYNDAVESTKGPKIKFGHAVITVENGRTVALREYNSDGILLS